MRRTFKIMQTSGDTHEILFEGKVETPEPLPTGKALDALIKSAILPVIKAAAVNMADLDSALRDMGKGYRSSRVCLVLYDTEGDPIHQMPIGIDVNNGRLRLMAWEDDD